MNGSVMNGSVMNVVCYECVRLWTWSVANVVCNERICNECGLSWMCGLLWMWSVSNMSLMNRSLMNVVC